MAGNNVRTGSSSVQLGRMRAMPAELGAEAKGYGFITRAKDGADFHVTYKDFENKNIPPAGTPVLFTTTGKSTDPVKAAYPTDRAFNGASRFEED